MDLSNIKLPSNRNFGFFFSFVFFVASAIFYLYDFKIYSLVCVLNLICIFIITLVKPDLLFSLNKIWMQFGLLLGTIMNPIVFGVIFFGMFTPIAILMLLFGRDCLHLKFKKKDTHWLDPEIDDRNSCFKNQF